MNPKGQHLRVLVVAEDPLVRAGLARMVDDQLSCQIVGQVDDGSDLEAALDIYRPHVALWDLGWDPLTRLERLAEVTESDIPVIALLPDEGHMVDIWAAGARALLLRDLEGEQLGSALIAASEGLVVLDPALAAVVLPDVDIPPMYMIEDLTPRELEVLDLMAEGLTNKAIAQRLNISEYTVKFHVNAILRKLGAQSRTEAAIRAARLGLITL